LSIFLTGFVFLIFMLKSNLFLSLWFIVISLILPGVRSAESVSIDSDHGIIPSMSYSNDEVPARAPTGVFAKFGRMLGDKIAALLECALGGQQIESYSDNDEPTVDDRTRTANSDADDDGQQLQSVTEGDTSFLKIFTFCRSLFYF
jgi:hypothetical protein